MKRVYLIHGWGGTSKSDFFLWLKNELGEKGIWNYFPDMPNTDEPRIGEWIEFLKKNIKEIDGDTILIGHSIGCQAVLRFLETLPVGIKVKKVILVAPWLKLDEQKIKSEGEGVWEIAKPWIETPINWKKIKSHCSAFVCIFSDNDQYVSLDTKEIFRSKLNAKVVILKNRYHFDEGHGIKKLPEILKYIK